MKKIRENYTHSRMARTAILEVLGDYEEYVDRCCPSQCPTEGNSHRIP